ncbi:MAG: RNA-binding S4 domain-containing protein [Oscillospiraceae bacterium]|nr:RNA-binding S4 domain-containing protein [Oscillospiraceae bacterium]
MRLDKYLKVSRIVKRRTVANELCDAKRVQVNGRAARASYAVQVGDEITITGANEMRVRVISISEHATKESAAGMFEAL